jgi:hypothetical protein
VNVSSSTASVSGSGEDNLLKLSCFTTTAVAAVGRRFPDIFFRLRKSSLIYVETSLHLWNLIAFVVHPFTRFDFKWENRSLHSVEMMS